MYSIPSHEIAFRDSTDLVREVDGRMGEYVERLEESAFSVDVFMGVIFSDVQRLVLMDPGVRDIGTWRSWVSAKQYYGAVMRADGVPLGEGFETLVGGRRIRVRGLGRPVNATPGKWLTSFFMAVTCRDEALWKSLCGITVGDIMKVSQGGGGMYEKSVFPWIASIQAFVEKKPGAFQYLDQAEYLCERFVEGRPEKSEKIRCLVRPKYDVLRKFIAGDSDGYNESLARALSLHKDYYSSSEGLRADPAGVMSLPLLGLACWGFDRSLQDADFEFQVDSGYLPQRILDGSWVDEGSFS
ncbi:immunity 49 family protein [Nocardiopsis changdeensis]|uniref:immunity 49 family protein n=1 Tax=Nocardiopsis changdeensis TaxID=2831969 RepID=UPI003F48C31D